LISSADLRIRYQTVEFGDTDIHLRSLRDSQEYPNDEVVSDVVGISSSNWSLFGVLWGAGLSLARLMSDYSVDGRRILEVGCGLGLASLVLNDRKADITATDYHPRAEEFLQENVQLNGGPNIPFVRANWTNGSIGFGKFDLIIGSDLLYERGQAETLATFIDLHARPVCEVIIVDPGRGQLTRFGRLMATLGYTDKQHENRGVVSEGEPSRGQTHSYFRGQSAVLPL
jgi:predicted nicotinamide N-methyase